LQFVLYFCTLIYSNSLFFLNMTKILITGTAGFIGFHLVQKLINLDYQIIGLDSINNYYDIDLKYARLTECGILKSDIQYNKIIQSVKYPNYKFIKLNLEDRENIDKLFENEQIDKVCNLAAQAGVRYSLENPYAYIQSNIVGFLNILEASKRNNIQHFVYASSSSVYGLNTQMPFSVHHNVDHPISLYAASKKSNELIAHSYSHLFKMPTTGLRFFTVYGPWGRPDMALFIFTKAILEGKQIDIYNNGEMYRDFTYIDDIVEGIKRVIENIPTPNMEWNSTYPDPATSPAPYQIYNIGNNNTVNLMDFIYEIEKQLGKQAIKNYMPMQAGDVKGTSADVNDLIKNLNYKPSIKIQYGIANFLDWYQTYYK